MPRKNESDEIVGVVGISWDVTTNAIMIHCLEEIIVMLENDVPHKEIMPTAKRGLSASRLRKMLEDKEAFNA